MIFNHHVCCLQEGKESKEQPIRIDRLQEVYIDECGKTRIIGENKSTHCCSFGSVGRSVGWVGAKNVRK